MPPSFNQWEPLLNTTDANTARSDYVPLIRFSPKFKLQTALIGVPTIGLLALITLTHLLSRRM